MRLFSSPRMYLEIRDVMRTLINCVMSQTISYSIDCNSTLVINSTLDNVSPNSVTYASVLKSCITLKTLPKGRKLHMEIAEEAQDIFDSLPNRDLVLWNTLLS